MYTILIIHHHHVPRASQALLALHADFKFPFTSTPWTELLYPGGAGVRDATQKRALDFDPPAPNPVIDLTWFQAASRSTTAWSIYIKDCHSSCIRFCPLTRLSQQASMDPSGVGQHNPNMPKAAQPTDKKCSMRIHQSSRRAFHAYVYSIIRGYKV